jgi:hypothetical protein
MGLEQAIAVGVVERPERLLPDVDAGERRLRVKDAPVRDELRQGPVQNREQECGAVMPV